MRKSFQLPVIAVCAVSLWTFSSCKKNENDPVCKIKTISTINGSSSSLITLTYNSDGKLSSVTNTGSGGGSSILFTYSGNTINVIDKNTGGTTTGSKDITLNSNGKIGTVLEKDAAGVLESTTTYQYDGNNNLSSVTSTPVGSPQEVSIVTYTNGNMTSITGSGGATTFDYYTDKSFQDGDYLKLVQYLDYGAFFITNNNLIKTYASSATPIMFTYEMDNTGKISKMTMTSTSSSQAYNYTYECK